jgi:hypothetical protein
MRLSIIGPYGVIAGGVLLLGILLLVGCGEGKDSVVAILSNKSTPGVQEVSKNRKAATESFPSPQPTSSNIPNNNTPPAITPYGPMILSLIIFPAYPFFSIEILS